MYFGHFAVAAALKAHKPDVPALPLFIGAGVIDIVNGLMIVGGADTVRGNVNTLPYLYFDLVFIDWDHSLLMAAVWSGLFAWLCYFFYQNNKVAWFAFLCSMLHWCADVPVHNQDLALYPYSDIKFGWGWWAKYGEWSWLIEVGFMAVLLAYAWIKSKAQHLDLKWQVVFLSLTAVNMSPWLSPMKHVAQLSEPAAHLLHGFLVTIGYVIPPLILVWFYARNRKDVKWWQA
ncbi:hypothetical protein [Neisseria chenwenguii]|uniref:Uncharacterized protein n=1 Tax=Neisseria chenwenguii TaxID=1853278 RepID=A0A220S1N2_9NEIS|nr:hypothetical protein [Neisseria chenwenguii]ASK27389.1 hypothetical protein BG910_06240 [Neisseria chenwenguii]ROV56939.1 hypothetical protein EGS38_01950 [Neisseria chenwenguii]